MGLRVPVVLPKTHGFVVWVQVLRVQVQVGLRRPVLYPCATLTAYSTLLVPVVTVVPPIHVGLILMLPQTS